MMLRGLIRRRLLASVAFGEITTAERLASGRGFRLHGRGWQKRVILVRRGRLRGLETQLRSAGVTIVDQYGACIDHSQFTKESDPEFNTKRSLDDLPGFWMSLLTPNFVARWRYQRAMRQWSDDATSE